MEFLRLEEYVKLGKQGERLKVNMTLEEPICKVRTFFQL